MTGNIRIMTRELPSKVLPMVQYAKQFFFPCSLPKCPCRFPYPTVRKVMAGHKNKNKVRFRIDRGPLLMRKVVSYDGS